MRIIRVLLRLIYPRHQIIGQRQLEANQPAVFVSNHLGAYSPIVLSLDFPIPFRPWVHAYITDKRYCRAYLEENFTARLLGLKPPLSGWLAALLAAPCIWVMKQVRAIPVYRGQMRIRETFNISVEALKSGQNILIFPENKDALYTSHVNDFFIGFTHLAWQYEHETGKRLLFYPVFVDKKSRTINIGSAVVYSSEEVRQDERRLFASRLRDAIDKLGQEVTSAAMKS